MAEATIPVDLLNPGQVFACLGFLEAADVLCGNAEGGFNWEESRSADAAQFKLRAAGGSSPIGEVLEFLAAAKIQCLKPTRWAGEPRKGESPVLTATFPEPIGGRMALPIRLRDGNTRKVADIDHWADGSSRIPFKLYAGNRSAYSIACNILHGDATKGLRGVKDLLRDERTELALRPFDVCTPMGGSFNFDPRKAWTAIDVGYSPDTQEHKVVASPVVEILAAWGMQHARPDEYETRQVRYGAWGALVPPLLARPALAGVDVAIPIRKFEFTLDLSGKNKVVTYSTEEVA